MSKSKFQYKRVFVVVWLLPTTNFVCFPSLFCYFFCQLCSQTANAVLRDYNFKCILLNFELFLVLSTQVFLLSLTKKSWFVEISLSAHTGFRFHLFVFWQNYHSSSQWLDIVQEWTCFHGVGSFTVPMDMHRYLTEKAAVRCGMQKEWNLNSYSLIKPVFTFFF